MTAQILPFSSATRQPHAPRRNEAKQGAGWPLYRGEMISPAAIRARMAEDMAQVLASTKTCVTTEHLLRLGWSRAQCLAHMHAATHLMAGRTPCGTDIALPGGDCA